MRPIVSQPVDSHGMAGVIKKQTCLRKTRDFHSHVKPAVNKQPSSHAA